jgi:hypothetical protein
MVQTSMTPSEPVTQASAPGGRPRKRAIPDTPFARWLRSSELSVREIADKLELTVWACYNLRNGYHKPSLEVAVQIAELSDGAVPVDSWGDKPKRTKARGKITRARRKAAAK